MLSGSLPNARPNAANTLRAWSKSKQIDQSTVLTFNKPNFQFPQEPTHRHPEVIPHHHDALHSATVALPQGLHQIGVFFFLLGVQPLLELVENDQHFLADRDALASPQVPPVCLSGSGCLRVRGSVFASHAATGFGFFRRGFDVNRDHILGQSRQQSRFDQRRFAATGWPVDQADRKRVVGIGFFDAGLPEPQAVGQAVTISGAGQQFQKEVGIVSVKRPQALRHDLDGLAVGRTRVSSMPRMQQSNRPKLDACVEP